MPGYVDYCQRFIFYRGFLLVLFLSSSPLAFSQLHNLAAALAEGRRPHVGARPWLLAGGDAAGAARGGGSPVSTQGAAAAWPGEAPGGHAQAFELLGPLCL